MDLRARPLGRLPSPRPWGDAEPLPLAAFQLSPREWRRFLWLEFVRHAREAGTLFLYVFAPGVILLPIAWLVLVLGDMLPSFLVVTVGFAGTSAAAGLVVAAIRLVPRLVSGWHLVPARKALVTIHPSGIVIAGRTLSWGREFALLTHVSVSRNRDLLTLQLEHRRHGEDVSYWDVTVLRVPLPRGVDTGAIVSRLTPCLRPTNYPGMYCAERTGAPAPER